MKQYIPSSFWVMFVKFEPVFTAPTFENFLLLVMGWIICMGKRNISRVIQFSLLGFRQKHHSILYRFFARAVWPVEKLTPILLALVLPLIPAGQLLYFLIDETLCRRSGPHIWGAGIHYDPLCSNRGRQGKKKVTVFANGHSWVIVSLWVPYPWNPLYGIALPVAFRLYVPKKVALPGQYRKRTELAREIIDELEKMVPQERILVQAVDQEFACRTCLLGQPSRVVSLCTMNMDAAFYAAAGPYQGMGAPRKKGERLLSPQQLAADETLPWEKKRLHIYGRDVAFLTKTQKGLWYHVAGNRLGRMVVTRDPTGRLEDRAYFCSHADWGVSELATGFSRRWKSEVMHRESKQHLGLDEPQNGWWRRPAGERRDKKKTGPQPDPVQGKLAATRTVPFILTVYTLVVVWYLHHGDPQTDVSRVRRLSPWYRHKVEPSFADMLASARRAFWGKRTFLKALTTKGSTKLPEQFLELIMTS